MKEPTVRQIICEFADKSQAAADLPWWKIGIKLRGLLLGQAMILRCMAEQMMPEPGDEEWNEPWNKVRRDLHARGK